VEINILTEILFGFGIGLSCAYVSTAFSKVFTAFQTVGDLG